METEKELIGYLQGKENIYIYGAGKNAGRLSVRLKKNGIVPTGYIVTEKEDNPSQIDGKRVWGAGEIADSGLELSKLTIVVAIAGRDHQLLDTLLDLGFQNILIPSQSLFCEMREREWVEAHEQSPSAYRLDMDYPDMEKRHIAVIEKRTGYALFRTLWDRSADTTLKKHCSREAFEQLYGTYHRLPCSAAKEMTHDDLKGMEIYVVTSHLNKGKAVESGGGKGVLLIQAGAALTSVRMGCLTDATGDHISEKNRDYCECTALYWIWKNTGGQEYVGLSQYRRRFRIDASGIRYIKEQDIDGVTVLPQFNHCSNKEFFSIYSLRHDLLFMREAILEIDPAYEKVMDQYEQAHFFIPCNMAILKRAWFDRYCAFAFAVAEKIEERYRAALIVSRKDRYMGYLFENLLSIFLIRYHEQMRLAYTDMVFLQDEELTEKS